MSNQTQQQIDTLIQIINDAEEPGTVTNLIVAAVLAFLADKVKTMATASALSAEVSALETVDASLNQAIQNEATARQAADTTLSDRISALQVALDRLMSGNVSDAIESFNEVISFLEEVTDDESLTGLLTAIDNRLNGVDEDLENKAGLHSNTGKVIYGQMPDVVLASMGFNLDNINAPSGTGIQYIPLYGDYYFDTNDNHIKYVDTGAIRDLNKPEPGLIYCNMKTNLTYRWIGSSWQPVGSSSNVDVINNLNSSDGTKPLSAAQGKRLKDQIDYAYGRLQAVYAALGNAAFWDSKTVPSTMLPALDWGNPKHYVTLALNITNAVVKYNGETKANNSTILVEEGSTLTLTVEALPGCQLQLSSIESQVGTVSGNEVSVVMGGSDITLDIEAEALRAHTVTVNATNCTASPSSATVLDGGSFTCELTPNAGCSLPATVSYGNGQTANVVNGSFTISNITEDITVSAESVQFFIDGYFIYSDGAPGTTGLTANVDWCYTKRMPFTGGHKLLLDFGEQNTNPRKALVTYGDESTEDSITQGMNEGNGAFVTTNYQIRTITTLDAATYARMSFLKAKIGRLFVVDVTSGDILFIGDELLGYGGFTGWQWDKSMHWNAPTTGGIVDEAGKCVTRYFEIPQGCTQIKYAPGFADTDWRAFAYDENYAIVGNRFSGSTSIVTADLSGASYANAKYMRFTFNMGTIYNTFIYDATNGVYLWAGSNVDTTVAPE